MTSMDTAAQPVTVEDFLAEATQRLDALADQPLSPAEFELWRITAHLTGALRMLTETGREVAETTGAER